MPAATSTGGSSAAPWKHERSYRDKQGGPACKGLLNLLNPCAGRGREHAGSLHTLKAGPSCLIMPRRDKSHPTDAGHQVLAELLASALLRAVAEEAAPPDAAKSAAGLAAWPTGSRLDGASRRQLELPTPMIPGNTDASTTLCAIQVRKEKGDIKLRRGCLQSKAAE